MRLVEILQSVGFVFWSAAMLMLATRRTMLRRLEQAGAYDETSAVALQGSKPWHRFVRSRLEASGAVRTTAGGLYWFDRDAWERLRNARQRRALTIVAGVLIIGAALFFLAGCGGQASQAPPAGPSTPAPAAQSGRIANLDTVADLLTYHQNAAAGSSSRRPSIIARWELPIPIFVDASASAKNAELAMDYWKSVTGLSYVILTANAEPRIFVRAGTDGLGTAAGRGLVDGTYADNRARSGLVVVRPDLAPCDFSQATCARIYEHELGHTIGLFDHVAGGGIMSGGTQASAREINMLVELYKLPHGTHIETDGTWQVVP